SVTVPGTPPSGSTREETMAPGSKLAGTYGKPRHTADALHTPVPPSQSWPVFAIGEQPPSPRQLWPMLHSLLPPGQVYGVPVHPASPPQRSLKVQRSPSSQPPSVRTG